MAIVIFDSKKDAAIRIAGARQAPDVKRVDDVAEMQVAGGRGRKPGDDTDDIAREACEWRRAQYCPAAWIPAITAFFSVSDPTKRF